MNDNQINVLGEPWFEFDDNLLDQLFFLLQKSMENMISGLQDNPFAAMVKGNRVYVMEFAPSDQNHKEELKRFLYQSCQHMQADFLVIQVDMWMAKQNPNDTNRPQPSNDPNRQEALSMIILRKDGEQCILPCFYERIDGKVVFKDTAQWYDKNFIQMPFLPAWGKNVNQTIH